MPKQYYKSYVMDLFLFFYNYVAETPPIPSRFDVVTDYNFSKVLLLSFFFLPLNFILFLKIVIYHVDLSACFYS